MEGLKKPAQSRVEGRELYDWIMQTQEEGEQILNEEGLNVRAGIRPMHVDYRAGLLLVQNTLSPEPILTLEEVELLQITRGWCRSVGRIIWGEEQYDRMRQEWPKQWVEKLCKDGP